MRWVERIEISRFSLFLVRGKSILLNNHSLFILYGNTWIRWESNHWNLHRLNQAILDIIHLLHRRSISLEKRNSKEKKTSTTQFNYLRDQIQKKRKTTDVDYSTRGCLCRSTDWTDPFCRSILHRFLCKVLHWSTLFSLLFFFFFHQCRSRYTPFPFLILLSLAFQRTLTDVIRDLSFFAFYATKINIKSNYSMTRLSEEKENGFSYTTMCVWKCCREKNSVRILMRFSLSLDILFINDKYK